jgi:hypothetical protein
MLTNKWFINHTWDVCTNTYRLLCKAPLFLTNCNKTDKLQEILSTFPTLLILSPHLMYHTLIHLSLYTVCPKSSHTLRLKYCYWANYTCCAAMLYSKEHWQTCRTGWTWLFVSARQCNLTHC